MSEELRLMAVLAHPDDESLGMGSTFARYSAEGIGTYLVTATRGQRGWTGDEKDFPGQAALGRIRSGELHSAAQTLGIRKVFLLDYMDGDLDQAPPLQAIAQIVAAIREVRPQVVATFGPDGAYGHPDHIAISQLTTAAVTCAADPEFKPGGESSPHRVSKLYYMVVDRDLAEVYTGVFGNISMDIDGVMRSVVRWEDWARTTVVDGSAHWQTALRAVNFHQSQVAIYGDLNKLPEAHSIALWGKRPYYRAFSLVNGGREAETDLFAGLR